MEGGTEDSTVRGSKVGEIESTSREQKNNKC